MAGLLNYSTELIQAKREDRQPSTDNHLSSWCHNMRTRICTYYTLYVRG